MTILSLRDAALAAGVSRQTIYRYAKTGKLSTVIRDNDTQGVDTSELIRVFGSIVDPATAETDTATSNKGNSVTARDSVLQAELDATKEALAIATGALAAARAREESAVEREAKLLEILDRQTKLLEHKPAVDVSAKELKKAGPKKLRRWLRQVLGED